MNKCKCNLRTRLVGDGCQYCNPAMHAEVLEQRCEDLEAELSRLRLTDFERIAVEYGMNALRVAVDRMPDQNTAAIAGGAAECIRLFLERTNDAGK